MKSGSIVALIVLAAVIIAGMISLARTPSSDPRGTIAPVNTDAEVPSHEPSEADAPAGLSPVESVDLDGVGRDTTRPSTLEPTVGTLTVRAVDAITGQPVGRFWLKPDGVTELASKGGPLLSKDGAITLPHTLWLPTEEGQPPLPSLPFLVSSPRHLPMSVELDQLRRADEERRLELLRAASIVGTVRDGSSAPLASARVTLKYYGSTSEFADASGEPIPLPDAYQGPTLRLTDAAGEYSFSQLPPGVYHTHVERAGTEHVSDPIFVKSGEWSLGDHWLDEYVRLTVTVLQADGTAAVDARILLVDAAAPLNASLDDGIEIKASRYTDAQGRATLGPLSVGEYGVYFQSDDGAAAPMTLEVTEASRSILELVTHLNRTDDR